MGLTEPWPRGAARELGEGAWLGLGWPGLGRVWPGRPGSGGGGLCRERVEELWEGSVASSPYGVSLELHGGEGVRTSQQCGHPGNTLPPFPGASSLPGPLGALVLLY